MRGQWLGIYKATENANDKELTVSGTMMVNVDVVDGLFDGIAYLNPSDGISPSTAALFNIPINQISFDETQNLYKAEVTAHLSPINPKTGDKCKWDEIKDMYSEDSRFSDTAKANFTYSEDSLEVTAETNINLIYNCKLHKSRSTIVSNVEAEKYNWLEFKKEIEKFSNGNFIFRGQNTLQRLRTSFHRKERYLLYKFLKEDVLALHRRLSSMTDHYFDLRDPEQNGAFLNLIQHHGYPTPLLDWSYSPYVAAFFAFRHLKEHQKNDSHVRVYIFDNKKWCSTYKQFGLLDHHYPHVSIINLLSINNNRAVPQQAVTMVSNIDDIEDYINVVEKESTLDFLKAIDIPITERDIVMNDLKYMGITVGSMFPSIDGICEELREINF